MRTQDMISDQLEMPDFIPYRGRSGLWFLVATFAILICVYTLLTLTLAKEHPYIVWVIGIAATVGAAFACVSRLQTILSQTVAAEFLNTQLANAFASSARFGIILKRDGSVTYANNGLREMFPQFAHNEDMALEALFDAGRVTSSDREDVWRRISHNEPAQLTFPIHDEKGELETFVIEITPLLRPKGFFALRGRPYLSRIENRIPSSNDAAAPDTPQVIESEAIATPTAPAITAPQSGLFYYIDLEGKLTHISPELEARLGYNAGDFLQAERQIDELLFFDARTENFDDLVKEFDHAFPLQRINQALIRSQVRQFSMVDAEGNVTSYIGIVAPL